MIIKNFKTWKIMATRIVKSFEFDRDYTQLLKFLYVINPYPLDTSEFSLYRDFILENLQAHKAGDHTRLSLTSSNSILNDEDDLVEDDLVEDELNTDPISNYQGKLKQQSKIEILKKDIQKLDQKSKYCLRVLITAWNKHFKTEELNEIHLPVFMQSTHTIKPTSTLFEPEKVKIKNVGEEWIITVCNKIVFFEQFESELFLLELVLSIDWYLLSQQKKTPYDIIETAIIESTGPATFNHPSQLAALVELIIENLNEADLLKG